MFEKTVAKMQPILVDAPKNLQILLVIGMALIAISLATLIVVSVRGGLSGN